ncbi:hypothetical protein AYO20_05802 [Fonsecaea nubica]|uniref:Heterokaryon incompatibility domain-containing protein n=1 Tax=Fonsecaea nubica TaxID=856822 RepID=A0A178D039_9EURO|nr:hypothetical protein AYO20_05802 [Fonsecaea nubica]OAL34842.1 hypothetical protein AYO20_05802 [Fonsecaea nubica]
MATLLQKPRAFVVHLPGFVYQKQILSTLYPIAAGETSAITVNEEQVLIRKNLWLCLSSLRQHHGDTSFRLWVDFLCINQRDIPERNWQVKMMADIYTSATGVFAWLGSATADSEIAFDYLDRARYLRQRKAKHSAIQRGYKAGKRAVTNLISRSYWGRLWIIQEVLLAQNLWIVAGFRSTDWDTLRYVAQPRQSSSSNRVKPQSANKQIFTSIWTLKRGKVVARPMHGLMRLFHAALCQDPRDGLYGLLAMTDEATRAAVRVEYGSPVLQVLTANYALWSDGTAWSQRNEAKGCEGSPLLPPNSELWSASTKWSTREVATIPSGTAHDPIIFIRTTDAIYSM